MKYTYRNKKFTAVFTDEDGYFSLTGDCDGGSGDVGDRIVEIDPRFKLMNDMHLSNAETGEPMHAESNGIYFAEQIIKKEGDYDIATIMRHLRVDHGQAKMFVEMVRDHNDMSKARVVRASDSAQAKIAEFFIKLRIQWKKDAADVREQAMLLHRAYEAESQEEDNDDDESFDWDLCDQPAKVKALSEYLECHPDDITEEFDDIFNAHGRDYLVLDDDEADKAWDEELDHYLEEIIYPELPDNVRNYFDDDKWKSDARIDGRGHSLGRYDGNENEVTTEYDGEEFTFYIYRQ